MAVLISNMRMKPIFNATPFIDVFDVLLFGRLDPK